MSRVDDAGAAILHSASHPSRSQQLTVIRVAGEGETKL
jgi:hypothetical protein